MSLLPKYRKEKPIMKKENKAEHIFDNVLMDYQKEAVRQMVRAGRALQYDDMGLGKTLQTLTAVEFRDNISGVTIICAPKFALAVWEAEISKWFGKTSMIYSGTPKQRKDLWNAWLKNPTSYIITNFAMLAELGSCCGLKHKHLKPTPPGTSVSIVDLKAIIIDEAHMSGLFRYTNNFYKVAKVVTEACKLKYILTGTPLRQGCIDLFGPLSLMDPSRFSHYWNFVRDWCVVLDTPFGKSIERNPANITAFRQMLQNYMIRRTKDEVLTELPGKRRQKLITKMGKQQEKAYYELQEELMTMIPETGDIILTPGAMSCILRQRQLLASPQLLGFNTVGSGVDAIMEHSHLRLDNNVPVVVFTSFRSLLPILTNAFKKEYPDANNGEPIEVFEIKGGLTAEEFGKAWKGFQEGKGPAVLLVVIKSGASFQATRADTAYFIGADWDPNLNAQAEDRLNRIGQTNFVNIFYVTSETPVEDRLWFLLNEKTESAQFITGTEQEYLEVLRRRKKGGTITDKK